MKPLEPIKLQSGPHNYHIDIVSQTSFAKHITQSFWRVTSTSAVKAECSLQAALLT